MIRVFLVDDHELVRRGIAEVIARETDLQVVGEAATVRAAVARVHATVPDVVVLDVRLPDGSGIDACRAMRERHPEIPCLVLTAFDDPTAREAAVSAGARGWVLKDIRGDGLVAAIRRVADGRTAFADRSARPVSASGDAATATDVDLPLGLRERQILTLVTQGLSNRQIGDRLGLAEKTVKNYVSGLLTKLGVERRTQIVIYGLQRGGSETPPPSSTPRPRIRSLS